jgi:hypothetical protein
MAIRRLGFLRVLRDMDIPPLLIPDESALGRALLAALNPDVDITRYRRRWRLSQPNFEDQWITGKLGFERMRDTERIYYDESIKDFVIEDAPTEAATFSHYVIDLQSQYLVFDFRPPEIRLQSFRGAFQAMLDTSPIGHFLSVEAITDTQEFRDWLETTDRIETFRVSVRRPNPSFQGRPERIRELLEETNAGRLDIEATAARDDAGLQVTGTDLETLAEYAADGYGKITARGQDGPFITRFSSNRSAREEEIEVEPNEPSDSLIERMKAVLARIGRR